MKTKNNPLHITVYNSEFEKMLNYSFKDKRIAHDGKLYQVLNVEKDVLHEQKEGKCKYNVLVNELI